MKPACSKSGLSFDIIVHKGCHALLCLFRAIGPAFPDKSCKRDCFCPFQQHGIHSDFRGCPLQCGPAGGAAPPGPAAVHRAPSLLHHVPGTHSRAPSPPPTIVPGLFADVFNVPLSLLSPSVCRLILTPTLKTGMRL